MNYLLQMLLDPHVYLLFLLSAIIVALAFPVMQILLPALALVVQRACGFPRNVTTGKEGMIGKRGYVVKEAQWKQDYQRMLMQVKVEGELWWASGEKRAERNSSVIVSGIDGLVLEVDLLPSAQDD